jgi:hypothetical protein
MKKLFEMPEKEAAGHSKKSGISLDDLKKMASTLGIVTTRSKLELVKSIKLKVENKKKLQAIEESRRSKIF